MTKKTNFFCVLPLIQVQEFGSGIRYGFEILYQCGKRVKTKSQKVLGSNFYVCRRYIEKTGTWGWGWGFCPCSPSWIGLIRFKKPLLQRAERIKCLSTSFGTIKSLAVSPHIPVVSLNTVICGPDKTYILTYFTQCPLAQF